MLVEKTGIAGKTATIKMITGEEIICHVAEDRGGELRITNPLSMVLVPGEEQEGMVAFAPWMLALDDDTVITIPYDKYIVAVPARRDAAAQYETAVGPTNVVVEPPRSAPQTLTGSRGGRGR